MGHFRVSSGGFWALAVLLWVSLISIQNGRLVCFGCPLKEYEALSELRSSLVRSNLTYPLTWARGERDCCLWERVHCNNSTRRVSQLMLSNLWDYYDQNWQLDLSIFSSFHELRLLNLSYNRINSSLSCIGLKKLEVLDLSENWIQGSIPSCFGSLSSLTVLNLGFNNLNGTLGLQEVAGVASAGQPAIGRLASLRLVDLSDNAIEGNTASQIFTSLEYLDLSDNYFILSNNDELGVHRGGGSWVPSF